MSREWTKPRDVSGELVTLPEEGEFYRIRSHDRMPPFLMTIASSTDLWMFLTSSGGLTAGRSSPDGSLFPYETVDRLYDAHHHSGPISVFRVSIDGRDGDDEVVWQPFGATPLSGRPVERSLYKSARGDEVIFQETDPETGLSFSYRWNPAGEMGWIRTCQLENHTPRPVAVKLLDGLRNVLPYGAPLALHQTSSSLIDAYRRVDLDEETGLAIYSLTAEIIDRAEPAESLRANTVWTSGLDDYRVALHGTAVESFRRDDPIDTRPVLTGERGNYFVVATVELGPGQSKIWHMSADVGKGHVEVANLRRLLRSRVEVDRRIQASIDRSSRDLWRIVAGADGVQQTNEPVVDAHHYANTLFNCMRGGAFADGYRLSSQDVLAFLEHRNRRVADRCKSRILQLGQYFKLPDLVKTAEEDGDSSFLRLVREYLPLHFGRRHGDPSRPWNLFEIKPPTSEGDPRLHYEGNWRDIFQNWEALGYSYPQYLIHMVAKFVNASTVDGFNPYRLTREGIDWEIEDSQDPWANIGYWGDHQIIYLLKLLEALSHFYPGALESHLDRRVFSYANVPYRIAPFEKLLEDPHSTIRFDDELAQSIEVQVSELGADGRLLLEADGEVYHATLLEKLLVPALSKVCNLVVGSGIWMNTQRPEWNDANNALVGYGVSAVTLCYLRRYLSFLRDTVGARPDTTALVSTEVVQWLSEVQSALRDAASLTDGRPVSDGQRMALLAALGEAFARYREKVYEDGLSGTSDLAYATVTDFCDAALRLVDHSVRESRREDRLYHSYSVLETDPAGELIGTRPLYEMLEGQVAVLSSSLLRPVEAIDVLESLFDSRMYRADQKSFLLYPERTLPSFFERNVIPPNRVQEVGLLRQLVREGDRTLVARDAMGAYRFHADFRNARDVAAALERLATIQEWSELVQVDRRAVLEVYEEVFHHREFTGRSGTMYGYEGIGCIYWHMVAKLLLATQEQVFAAVSQGCSDQVLDRLRALYYRVRGGLGFEKSVLEYGAFPIDPYSHTPRDGGARQPGMTGQVKEEILTRLGELGVRVVDGRLTFHPVLLRKREFLETHSSLCYLDVHGVEQDLPLEASELGFTFAQVPVILAKVADTPSLAVRYANGNVDNSTELRLDAALSESVFARDGSVQSIRVGIPGRLLLEDAEELEETSRALGC